MINFINHQIEPMILCPLKQSNEIIINNAAQEVFNIKRENISNQDISSVLDEKICFLLRSYLSQNKNKSSDYLGQRIAEYGLYDVYAYSYANYKVFVFKISKATLEKQGLAFQRLAKKATGQDFNFPLNQLVEYGIQIQEFYEAILALMPEHVYWKDRAGTYLGCNIGVAASAGLQDRKDIVGKTDKDMVWHSIANEVQKNDQYVVETGQSLSFNEVGEMVGGKKKYYLSTKVPLLNSRQEIVGVLGISTNITSLKDTEASLRQAKEEAEEANKAKSEFLAMMTHELRTPLNVIMGMVQIMQRDHCNEEQREEYFSAIMRSSKSLLGLINDILDYSKAQSGKLQVLAEPFELQPLLNQLYTEFNVKGKQHGTQFIVEKDESLPSILVADELRLRQVIYNLCDNAMKFTSHGSVTLRLTQYESQKPDHAGLRIEVIDTGIGIPKDKLETVFEQFTQVSTDKHNEYSRKYGGVGLGLAIVRHLINLMHGKISVASELGKGTTFTCEFEFALATNQQLALIGEQTKKRAQNLEKSLVRRQVLVVEDNLLNQKVVSHMLTDLNCEVDVANDGSEALAKMQKSYDIVFMDMSLPDMSGIEVTEQFRKREPVGQHQRIIALSANVHADDQQKCFQAGMDGFLPKPIMFDELKELVASL